MVLDITTSVELGTLVRFLVFFEIDLEWPLVLAYWNCRLYGWAVSSNLVQILVIDFL